MSENVWGNKPLDQLNAMPGYPRQARDEDNNWSLTFRYFCGKSYAYSLAPAHNSAPPSPYDTDFSTLKCKGVTIEPSRSGEVVTMTVEYRVSSSYVLGAGETRRSASHSVIEKPIDEHPDLNDDAIAAQKAAGRYSYIQHTVTYRYAEVQSSFTWSQANVISGVGSTGSPDGMSSATSARWLKIGRDITEEDAGTRTVDIYQYDENEWQQGTF